MGRRTRIRKLEEKQRELEIERLRQEKRDAARERREERRSRTQAAIDAMTPQERSKAEKRATVVLGVVGAVILLIIIAAVASGGHEEAGQSSPRPASTTPTRATSRATAERSRHATPPSKAAAPLAPTVKKTLLQNLGVTSFTQTCGTAASWACPITDISDNGSGDVTVHVQEKLSRDEAKDAARRILQLTCLDATDLQWVSVEDTSGGVAGQVQRSSAALCR
ncbi:hypothetical protein [Acidipropionibacterium timonense]|uniref:hypothetical protein n=1 Tax=Acidipropionibacterium timonense TaxID=2161818 RepID=UPI001031FF9D|nr:hypothetical protein [Acidipropionibacterium timonense]